jgi:glycosyltransferase involved in cell wall biosynthesis
MAQTGSNPLPLVSLGILSYNQKEYLKECLDSALSQTYPNLEIVVGDDASTDGTQQMLKEYQARYPNRLKIILASENGGITANSNRILKECKGDYLVIMDGDDWVGVPDRIEKQVKYLQNHPEVALCGSYVWIMDENSNLQYVSKPPGDREFYTQCELIESANGIVPRLSYMFRREHLPPEGFEKRIPMISDALFYYHIAQFGKIGIIREPLTYYRVYLSTARKRWREYREDSLVTQVLALYRYPHCRKKGVKGLHRVLLFAAKDAFKRGDPRSADLFYISSQLRFLPDYLFYIADRLGVLRKMVEVVKRWRGQ